MVRKYTDHIVDPHVKPVVQVIDVGEDIGDPFEEISKTRPFPIENVGINITPAERAIIQSLATICEQLEEIKMHLSSISE